ncbi:hypothetical protein H5P28_13490 [Ruficoccus amylovorans]|uniref:Transporter n=1 Tax=Ruficoccus amylovorans TaxID=1804625 RepID=A0A842HI60_9BACT|nr:hypothetical protein [Ruficoccus amylovorans]MBC2595276.1 hypothetical protein [Ruficoccus amylovorans]
MTIEYVTLGLYFLMLIGLGVALSRLNKNVSDFVRGGAQATWWLAGASMLMAGISAFTFTGNASAAFEAGPSMMTIYIANCVAYAISALFLGAWLRQTRAYTVVDVIRARFGLSAEQFSGYTMLMLNPIAAAIQLWALAVFASSVFGFALGETIVGIGIIVIIYSTIGGRWAIMATDFAQSLILLAVTILVAVLALAKIGGVSEFLSYFSDPRFAQDFRFVKEAGQFPGDRFTLKWIIVIFFMQLYVQINMNNASRFLSLKDGREASRASWFAFVLMALGSIIWFIPPMVARFLYEGEVLALNVSNPSEASYAFIAMKLLPNGMMGVMIAAMFAATISSMDTGVNNQVGIVVRNIIPRLLSAFGRKPLTDKGELFLCKVVTVILGLMIINFSLIMAGQGAVALFDAYLVIASVIGIPLGFPMLTGLYIRRMPKSSYFTIFAFCLLPSLYSFYDAWAHGTEWTIQDRALWCFVFGLFGTLVSMAQWKRTRPEARASIDRFFEVMLTPVDYLKEIGASMDFRQLVIMGNTACITGAVLCLLLLVPNPWTARVGILFVAGFILCTGLLLRYGAKVEKRKQQALAKENKA